MGGGDAAMLLHHPRDLAGLDPQAIELDLLINTAEPFDAPVGTPAPDVAAAIEPAAACGIGDELARRQVGLPEIAARG